ncbi:MAG: hypothetical protein ACTSRZ_20930 [Promethearchaeota archaeon]
MKLDLLGKEIKIIKFDEFNSYSAAMVKDFVYIDFIIFPNSTRLKVKGILDSGSQISFYNPSLFKFDNIEKTRKILTIKGVNNKKTIILDTVHIKIEYNLQIKTMTFYSLDNFPRKIGFLCGLDFIKKFNIKNLELK